MSALADDRCLSQSHYFASFAREDVPGLVVKAALEEARSNSELLCHLPFFHFLQYFQSSSARYSEVQLKGGFYILDCLLDSITVEVH